MNTITLHRLWVVLLCSLLTVPLVSCIEGGGDDDDTATTPDDDDTTGTDDDDSASGDDDDTSAGDDDTGDDDDDDSQAAASAPSGQTLCAAGGRVSGKGISGVVCLGPVDLAAGSTSQSADGSLVWHPGPITRIAP